MNKEKLIALLKQKTTWLGIAGLLIAAFGLDNLSAEQIAVVAAGLVAVIYPEKPKA
jgi:hypothetical protein